VAVVVAGAGWWLWGRPAPGPQPLAAFADRVEARPAVQLALRHEGLA